MLKTMIACLASTMLAAATLAMPAAAAEPYFMTAAQGKKPPFKIGVSNGYIGNTWRAQFLSDIEQVATELKAAGDFSSVTILNSTSGAAGQIAQVNTLINSGVDALVINPVSGEALKPVLTRARAAGILVVVADDPLADKDVLNIVLDNAQFWDIETRWLVEKLGGKGNIVSIDGLAGNTGNDWRIRARDAVLAQNPGIKVLAEAPGAWDQAKAREVMSSFLSAHADIDGVLVQDVMAEGVYRAFETSGRKLVPMSGDYLHSFLKLWSSKPEIDSIAVANPPGIGADALRITAAMMRGAKLDVSKLQANPFAASVINTILIPEPIVITRNGDTDKPWCTAATECISVAQALERLKGKDDSAALDAVMTQQQTLDRYFTK